MGEKINLKFVRPECSSRINTLLGTNRVRRDGNTLLWTCWHDCFEDFLGLCFFFTLLVMFKWLHPPQEGHLSTIMRVTVL